MGNVIYSNVVGGSTIPKSYILETEDGVTMVGVLVGEETVMTAKPSDIKIGKLAATNDGIVEGTNTITYRTTQSTKLIRPGSSYAITLSDYDQYDYTKLQCVIVNKNTSVSDSVAAEKVVIEGVVYQVGSTEQISTVTKNINKKSIDFNLINDTNETKYIRYFTYKDEEE